MLWSHRTGDGRKGLIAHSGAKLVTSNATSSGEATETTRKRLERRETDQKRRGYGENIGDTAPSWILTVTKYIF